jgi:hypothetical protein
MGFQAFTAGFYGFSSFHGRFSSDDNNIKFPSVSELCATFCFRVMELHSCGQFRQRQHTNVDPQVYTSKKPENNYQLIP